MNVVRHHRIRSYEIGLVFRNGEFSELVGPGEHWYFDPLGRVQVDVKSQRDPWLVHEKLDLIVKSGLLNGRAVVVDLKDDQRALVWLDGRFSHILPPGLFAYWIGSRTVRVEVVDIRNVRFDHPDLKTIARSAHASRLLEVCRVERDRVGVLYVDGRYVETLAPGEYAFWRGPSEVQLVPVDLREAMVDIAGQEIMTADKVTIRINAVATYRIADPQRALSRTEDVRQALYREAQLVLRALVGGRELDQLLGDREALGRELEENLRRRAEELGLHLVSVGVRDLILPGDMKELMNRVTEARKAAEANLIVRREETAAMRSQANTAKLLQENPTLMRLRELELVEKVAATGKVSIMLGEKGLSERLVNLL